MSSRTFTACTVHLLVALFGSFVWAAWQKMLVSTAEVVSYRVLNGLNGYFCGLELISLSIFCFQWPCDAHLTQGLVIYFQFCIVKNLVIRHNITLELQFNVLIYLYIDKYCDLKKI